MGALNGKVLDADGSSVLLDIYDRFGVQRQTLSMGLNDPDTNVQVQCVEALDMQEDALGKTTHKSVQTKHQDPKSGELKVVDLENDESPSGLPPVHTDRHIYPNKTAAEQAGKARLAAFNRSTAGVRLEMAGRTDLFAERLIIAQGFKVGLDGEYLVDSVEQVFTQSGWTTTVECNGGKKGKAKAGEKKAKESKELKTVDLQP